MSGTELGPNLFFTENELLEYLVNASKNGKSFLPFSELAQGILGSDLKKRVKDKCLIPDAVKALKRNLDELVSSGAVEIFREGGRCLYRHKKDNTLRDNNLVENVLAFKLKEDGEYKDVYEMFSFPILSYDKNKMSNPWIAALPTKKNFDEKKFVFGVYDGDENGGELIINARQGDVLAIGQKHFYKRQKPYEYFVIGKDRLIPKSIKEVYTIFMKREEFGTPVIFASFEDDAKE